MIYLQLFWSFIQIGFTSFGGLSMIPLIKSEMLSHGWMTESEVSDIVAIAEMTPGPLGLNCATFAGMRTGGVIGAAVANLGALMPTLTVTLLVAIFFEKWRKNRWMERALIGIRPACIGMIAGVIISLGQSNYAPSGSIDVTSIAIGLIALFLLIKGKYGVPKVIGICALLGLIFC